MSSSPPPPPWDYIAKLVCIGDSGCGKSSLTIRLCEGRFIAHHDVTIGVEFGSRIVPVGPPHSRTLPATSTVSLPKEEEADAADTTRPSVSSSDGTTVAAKKLNGLPEPRRRSLPAEPQKHMKLSLWDTAGQETYKSVTRSYFRGASGALLVFDLSRKQTFLHVKDWLDDLRQIADPDIVVVLVGNKADLAQASQSADNIGSGNGDGIAGDSPNQRQVTREEAQDWARRNGVLEYVETSAKSGENVEHAFLRVAERIYQKIQAGRYDLNDRRSGVKGPGFAAPAVSANGRPLRLDARAKSSGGGCC
ncbi:secretion related GTPase [Grosmannia clavigera kw1407]|uniref:Secretion related GTPase n=1 Tax=Grosmannia clavigera (strain kw1407 / UAMH 11150) TaxID=655863 RepID=F0XTS4_GROCL|nr:secretion related GTPase [Grosmannia clavigera kw1407]EFW98866.1 secretion related GTPase [Grosmannia clavigera kw1407]